MKRILFVIPALGIGGAEKSLIDLFNEIDYTKYNVTLLLLNGHGDFFTFVNKNVKIIHLNGEARALLQNLSQSLPCFFKQGKIITCARLIINSLLNRLPNKIRPNMAHVVWKQFKDRIPDLKTGYDVAIGYLQGLSEYYVVDKVTASKKIFWMHTCFGAHSKNDQFEISYIMKYNKIVCVSEAAKNDFINLFPSVKDKTVVFYNIINKKAIEMKSCESPEIMFNKSFFNIVSVGRLHHCKGYDIALESISKIVEIYPKIHYYIIGGGVEKSNIERIISDLHLSEHCTLLGARSNPYKFLKQADILLQSSRYEGFCIALSEALALGKPIITTNFFGAKEQVIDGKTGLIVECNKDDIYNALYRIINDEDLFHNLKKNASVWNRSRNIQEEFSFIIN